MLFPAGLFEESRRQIKLMINAAHTKQLTKRSFNTKVHSYHPDTHTQLTALPGPLVID